MIVVSTVAFGALVVGFLHFRRQSMTRHCQTAVSNIATALQAYAGKHQGDYPEDLERLRKDGLLAGHEVCWVAEKTYDGAYRVSADHKSCSVCCKGDLHGLGQDQPDWHSPPQPSKPLVP